MSRGTHTTPPSSDYNMLGLTRGQQRTVLNKQNYKLGTKLYFQGSHFDSTQLGLKYEHFVGADFTKTPFEYTDATLNNGDDVREWLQRAAKAPAVRRKDMRLLFR